MNAPVHEQWKIGPEITDDDVLISGLHHVSEGSWQPVLCLKSGRRL